jgi:hypothetical protein
VRKFAGNWESGILAMFKRGFVPFFYAPDKGDGGGTGGTGGGSGDGSGDGSQNTGGKKDGEGNGDGTDNAGKGNGDSSNAGKGNGGDNSGKGNDSNEPEKRYTQADLDRIAAKARDEERRKAADAKLKEEGKFKDLHAALETRVKDDLEPKAALAERLALRVNSSIDAEVKDWPPSLKKTDPGKDDVEKRLQWAENSRDLAKELGAGRKAPNGEHGDGSDARGNGKKESASTAAQVVGRRYRVPGKQS